MQGQNPDQEESKAPISIPSKLRKYYEDFKLISESPSFKLYEAITKTGLQRHMIRILDSNTNDQTRMHYPQLAVLFVQELLHLQMRYPGSVITKSFDTSEENEGKQIFCATLPYSLLKTTSNESKEIINPKDFKTTSRLIGDILSDANFLLKELRMKDIIKSLGVENVVYFKESENYMLTNWAHIQSSLASDLERNDQITESTALKQEKVISSDIALELKTLGLIVAKFNSIATKDIEYLFENPSFDPKMLNLVVNAKVAETMKESKEMHELIAGLLTADPKILSNVNDFVIKGSIGKVFDSTILKEVEDIRILCKWISGISYPTCELLYRGSRDGYTANAFHTRCNNKGPTVVVIKSEFGKIFGGFTDKDWKSSGDYQNSSNCFLFSIDKKGKYPLKAGCEGRAIYCHSSYGPMFGSGNDIRIYDNCNTSNSNYSNFPHGYVCNEYVNNNNSTSNYLAGAYNFKVQEIEVFSVTK